MNYLEQFLFGIYPYIAMIVFLAGSLIRFDREQYTWKSDSSQLLRRGQLRWGSNLFHVGVLFLFFGHFVGLLTPHAVYEFVISAAAKQTLAIVSGGIAGSMALVGMILLVHRRLAEPRIRATSTRMDIFILLWILATLVLGLVSIAFSLQHRDGSMMIVLGDWAQHIMTFRAGAADVLANVPLIYKIHLFFGLTVFLLFPFSRLVHIWSGLAAVGYVFRAYQIVRRRA
jgi:nitrate reductase gamma subunit